MKRLRIAHLSDLHFSKVSYNPAQFLSKRWRGNLNLLLFRKKSFNESQIHALVPELKKLQVDELIITGDLSSTSRHSEFEKARAFIEEVRKTGIEVSVLPGNHDNYTKKAFKKQLFYQYFSEDARLKKEGIGVKSLSASWTLITLDTAPVAPLFSAHGIFSPSLEELLEKTLASISKDQNIILANHFPFFKHIKPKNTLLRGDKLQELIAKYPRIRLYLHGHAHLHTLADLRKCGLPIISDSGCAADIHKGSWTLFDIEDKRIKAQMYRRKEESWELAEEHQFHL